MTSEQARIHNASINEKIKELQSQYVLRHRIRVIERQENGRRQVIEENTTDYISGDATKSLYEDYRGLYKDAKTFFILIDEIEDVKRVLKVALPMRTDGERQPPAHLSDPVVE